MAASENAMATLQELLDDKSKYPNDMKITFEGVETTVGDVRSGFMKDSDYRKKTTEVSLQRRELERQQQEFAQAKLDAEQQLENYAKSLMRKEPDQTKDELQSTLENDPVAKALMGQINGLKTELGELREFKKTADSRLKEHETAFVASQHRAVLNELKKYDPDLDTQALVNFAKDSGIARLDYAYRLMTEEDRIKRIRDEVGKEAKEKGIEEGKKLINQPRLPTRRSMIVGDEKVATSFDEAAENALNDPEIITLLQGEGNLF